MHDYEEHKSKKNRHNCTDTGIIINDTLLLTITSSDLSHKKLMATGTQINIITYLDDSYEITVRVDMKGRKLQKCEERMSFARSISLFLLTNHDHDLQ